MALAQLIGCMSFILGCWWLFCNVWIFPSLHDHGKDRGCGRIKLLPSSLMRPFGLDKLLKILDADKIRKLPVCSLGDHEKYGDTYAQYAGGLFTIITRDPRNIASLLSEQFSKFGHGQLRQVCFGPLLGESIFTADGAAWKASRRLIATELSKPLNPALHAVEPHFQDLVQKTVSLQGLSSVIDLRPLLHDYALDTATALLLGNSTHILRLRSNAETEGLRFSKAFNTSMKWLAIRERFKMFAWIVTTPRMRRAFQIARDSLQNLILQAQRVETESGPSTFSHFLGKTASMHKARDELMGLLFAARDSNASLLCWLVYALAREPKVFAKVHMEVLSVLGHDPASLPNESQLAQMRYLDHVIYETLRLFPAVPINGRLCCEATTLPAGGGDSGEESIWVPKGALICFSTFACQRSTKYYGGDAQKFRPERWQEIGIKTRSESFEFHPFIRGPRKCLGERFALKLAKYTLCRIAQTFGAIVADDSGIGGEEDWLEQVRYQIGLTMSPNDSIHVRLQVR